MCDNIINLTKMGNSLQSSREEEFDLEEETSNRTIKFWEDTDFDFKAFKISKTKSGTLPDNLVLDAFDQRLINLLLPVSSCKCDIKNKKTCSICKRASYCCEKCQKLNWKTHKKVCIPTNEFKILEVGAGSGWHTKNIISKFPFLNIISTDYIIPEVCYYKVDQYLSHQAVKEFEGQFHALLLISPPPNIYVDYYAIKEYELQKTKKRKIVIYIGELGASDGGRGMYKYMLENPIWKLIHRKVLNESVDPLGGPCIKELFVFTD